MCDMAHMSGETDVIWTRDRYLAAVRDWAMFMLITLRGRPNTAEKLTLLQQVDKVKTPEGLDVSSLPGFAAALAYLSIKGARLARGQDVDVRFTPEVIAELLKSDLLKRKFTQDPKQFYSLKDYLKLRRLADGSEVLRRLAEGSR